MLRSLLLAVLLSACFAPPPDEPPLRLRVSITDFGAVSGGGDDHDAFRAALDALDPWSEQVPMGRPTLIVPAGDWHILRDGLPQGLVIDQSVDIVCEPGSLITGPDDDQTSKDLFAAGPAVGSGEDLEGVGVFGCTFRYDRTHSSNEQAHALSFYSGNEAERWLRGVRIRDVTCEIVGSGDCVYLGADVEDVRVVNVTCVDVSRACIAVTGGASGNSVRRGFYFETIQAGYDVCTGTQCDELSIDFEPPENTRLLDVTVKDVRAPATQLDAMGLENATFEDIYVRKIAGARLSRTTFDRVGMTCEEGAGGDGDGYCVVLNAPPYDVQMTDVALEVNPLGAGAFYLRDEATHAPTHDYRMVYAFDASGFVRLNGGQKVRADILSDPLLVRIDDVVELP